jgi:hypothetical protein
MHLSQRFICIICLFVFVWTSAARADFDISPRWSGTSGSPINTYGYDDGLAPAPEALTSDTVRVFQFDMDNPGPNTTTDPGIHALSTDSGYTPSGFPDGSWVTFDVLSDLKYWNGSSFSTVPANESLSLQLGPDSVTAATGTGTQAGFLIGKVGPPSQSSEGLHVHLSSTITGPGGSDPTDGIYMFEMDLKLFGSDKVTPYPGVGTSLPFWVIYDHDLNDPNDPVDEAVAYQNNLVPEPSSLVLAALGGLVMFASGWSKCAGRTQLTHSK